MAWSAYIRWRQANTRRCLFDALYLSVILLFRRMDNGQQSRASRHTALIEHRTRLKYDSELTVKIVNIEDPQTFIYIRDCPKPAKHLTYDPSGSYLAISCTDGVVYIYKLSTEQPELVRKVDGLIRQLETDAEASSKAIWHPDGRAFAVPTATREIQIISSGDGEKQRVFAGAHTGEITALAWSPNGALLLSAATDKKIVLWETKTQKVLAR